MGRRRAAAACIAVCASSEGVQALEGAQAGHVAAVERTCSSLQARRLQLVACTGCRSLWAVQTSRWRRLWDSRRWPRALTALLCSLIGSQVWGEGSWMCRMLGLGAAAERVAGAAAWGEASSWLRLLTSTICKQPKRFILCISASRDG